MFILYYFRFAIGVGGKLINHTTQTLPYSIDNCSNETLAKVSNFTDILLKHQSHLQSQNASADIPEL